MNAQLRWRAVACANHMDFVDALAPLEVTNQPSDAAVGVAIYLWQEQRDIKLHLVSHNAIHFCRRRRLGAALAQRAGKGEVRGECKRSGESRVGEGGGGEIRYWLVVR